MKKKVLISSICTVLLCCIILGVVLAIPGASAPAVTPTAPTGGLMPDLLGSSSHLVIFYTNGGIAINPRQVAHNTVIGALPTPHRQGDTFAGWYYDASMTMPAADTDPITADICLYASYADQTGQVETETNKFTATTKAGSDFAITVLSSNPALSPEEVKALITAKNLSRPEDKDFITVTGQDGVYQIVGTDGFAEGCTFRITLDDGRLSYLDQSNGVRDYNFTTDMQTVANVKLSDDLIYLHIDELSDIINNGAHVTSLNVPLLTISTDGTVSASDLTNGQFTYRGEQSLHEGDTVAIYSGIRPDLRTTETTQSEAGDVAFLQILSVEGDSFSYTGAKTADVIFRPDILPIDAAADQDHSDTTVTLDSHLLDYSNDIYAKFRLDSGTTADCGDYIVLYTGDFGTTSTALGGYGKITHVEVSGENTVITYEPCGWDTVQSAMDLRTEQTIDGDYLLADVDREALEASVVQQAVESGFAQEAAIYLVTLATATEEFTDFSKDMNLTDIRVTLEDGSEVDPQTLHLMANEKKAKVELSKLAASINDDPKHFEGSSGVRLTVEIGVKITFAGKDADKKIVLEITGAFEMECCIALDVSGHAIFNTVLGIPYIDDYRIAVAVDLMDYIGVTFDVNMSIKEKKADGNWTEDKKADEKLANIKKALKTAKILLPTGDVLASDQLADQYGTMLAADTEWVTLFEKSIFSKKFGLPPALPVVGLELKADFVVSTDASVAMGLDYYHSACDRYVYALNAFSLKLSSDVVKIQDETYEFTAYVMGRVGIRAGVRISMLLFVTDSDYISTGCVAEVGSYIKFRGYFYYELHYSTSGGRTSEKYGAMTLEVGNYRELKIVANLFKELASGDIMIKDEETPLFRFGRVDDVHDFVLTQEQMPDIKLKQHFRTAVLPYELFNMHYMDLLDGKMKTATYDPKFFTIEISNDAFTFDPVSKILTVNPQPGDVKLEGTITINWNLQEGSYQQHPPKRTINLYWDNLKEGYIISPETSGGSYVPIIVAAYQSKIAVPADPVKQGYVFAGWFTDKEHTEAYTFPATMPNEDTVIYAAWTPAEDTEYTVSHYQQVLGSSTYELVENQTLTGTTDSTIVPEALSYEGFVTPAQREITIRPDGSAELHYYYDRIISTLTFDPGIVDIQPITYTLQYGALVSAPRMAAPGYDFLGYDAAVPDRMGSSSVTYTAQWEKANAKFIVEYYVQQPDGRYVLQDKLSGAEILDTLIPTKALLEEWTFPDGKTATERFALPGAVEFENITVGGKDLTESGEDLTVLADMVVKVRFRRLSYTATFDPNNGQEPITMTLYSGQALNAPAGLTRTGYAFDSWDTEVPAVMGAENLKFTAKWSAANYTVSFHANGGTGTMSEQGFCYDTATPLSPNTFERPGYSFAGWSTEANGSKVYDDGEEVNNLAESGQVSLYALWEPLVYEIIYRNAEDHGNPTTYTIESGKTNLSAPKKRVGYTFAGWVDLQEKPVDSIAAGSTGDLILTARWTPNTNTAYTVKHLLEDISGEGYTLQETQRLTGTTDSTLTPKTLTFEGFTAPRTQTVTVAADGTLVVEYRYSRNIYALTFEFNDGNTDALKITGKYGSVLSIPAPEREGYGFGGWFAGNAPTGSPFTSQTMPAKSMTLYGQWEPNTYSCTVNHYTEDLDGNWSLANTDHLTGTMDGQLTPDVKQYTGFTTPEKQTITIGTGNNTVNYYYIRNRHLLTWNPEGGTVTGAYTSGQVCYGQPITPPQVTKVGHTGKWDKTPAITMPDESLTYSMVWTPNTYTVTMDLGTGDTTVKKIKFGQPVVLPNPSRLGYTFGGWNETVPATMPAQDLRFTAKWDLDTYTIQYDMDGATNLYGNPTSYNVTQLPIALKTPHKAGYTFLGWYENGIRITSLVSGKVGNRTLTAKWQANSYQVIFHANDGSNATKSQDLTYDVFAKLTPNTFQRKGYRFLGWSTTATGSVVLNDNQQLKNLSSQQDSRVDLYAVWELIEYSVTYEGLENATNDSRNPSKYTVETDSFTLYAPTSAPNGKHFAGWYLDPDYTVSAGTSYTAATLQDVTFYAKWDWNTYQIQFDDNRKESTGVDGVQPELVSNTFYTLETAAKLGFQNPGYTFGGWATEPDGAVVYRDAAQVNFTVNQNNDVVKLYAHWVPIPYKVTYNRGDGGASVPAAKSFTVETGEFALEDPTAQPGHRFTGWYDASGTKWEVVKKGTIGDITLTARWEHIVYTITLDNQGADISSGTVKFYVKYSEGFYSDQSCTQSIWFIDLPRRLGYHLSGYYEEVSNNGAPSASGTKMRIGNLGNIGESFTSTTYTRDVVLKALWYPQTYEVIYDANGGSGSTASTTHTYGVSSALRTNGFTKNKYIFLGWSESATATTAQYAPNASVLNLATSGSKTLYAVWTPVTTHKYDDFGSFTVTNAITGSNGYCVNMNDIFDMAEMRDKGYTMSVSMSFTLKEIDSGSDNKYKVQFMVFNGTADTAPELYDSGVFDVNDGTHNKTYNNIIRKSASSLSNDYLGFLFIEDTTAWFGIVTNQYKVSNLVMTVSFTK